MPFTLKSTKLKCAFSGISSGMRLNHWTSQMALVVKNPPANAGDIRDTGSIPGSGRTPGEGNGNPLQCSCLGNPMDRGTWWATDHGVAKELDTT